MGRGESPPQIVTALHIHIGHRWCASNCIGGIQTRQLDLSHGAVASAATKIFNNELLSKRLFLKHVHMALHRSLHQHRDGNQAVNYADKGKNQDNDDEADDQHGNEATRIAVPAAAAVGAVAIAVTVTRICRGPTSTSQPTPQPRPVAIAAIAAAAIARSSRLGIPIPIVQIAVAALPTTPPQPPSFLLS